MEWLVAVGRVDTEFLSNPAQFLSNPDSRIQPGWAYGIVRAKNQSEAYDAGLDLWDRGLLNPDFRFGCGTFTHPIRRHALICAGSTR